MMFSTQYKSYNSTCPLLDQQHVKSSKCIFFTGLVALYGVDAQLTVVLFCGSVIGHEIFTQNCGFIYANL